MSPRLLSKGKIIKQTPYYDRENVLDFKAIHLMIYEKNNLLINI